ncbi:hypothetical protein D3C71_1991070 [compost metagenome]
MLNGFLPFGELSFDEITLTSTKERRIHFQVAVKAFVNHLCNVSIVLKQWMLVHVENEKDVRVGQKTQIVLKGLDITNVLVDQAFNVQ